MFPNQFKKDKLRIRKFILNLYYRNCCLICRPCSRLPKTDKYILKMSLQPSFAKLNLVSKEAAKKFFAILCLIIESLSKKDLILTITLNWISQSVLCPNLLQVLTILHSIRLFTHQWWSIYIIVQVPEDSIAKHFLSLSDVRTYSDNEFSH